MTKEQAQQELTQLRALVKHLHKASDGLSNAYLYCLDNKLGYEHATELYDMAKRTNELIRFVRERMTPLDEAIYCKPQAEQEQA